MSKLCNRHVGVTTPYTIRFLTQSAWRLSSLTNTNYGGVCVGSLRVRLGCAPDTEIACERDSSSHGPEPKILQL